MTQPSTPELDLIDAQILRLKEIDKGDDWHSDLGHQVHTTRLEDDDPLLHCWPTSIITSVEDEGVAMCQVTWTAIVPIEDDLSALTALEVLADMRAALVSQCPMGTTDEVGSEFIEREPGSNYQRVKITVQSSFVIEGLSNG